MIFKQPKPFYLIFVIELLERFGYYGLQSIIVVYLINKISISEKEAIDIFSSFTALTYGLVVIGGWLGDKCLGIKRTLILGLSILILGYTTVWLSQNNINTLYIGITLLTLGNSLFKSAPSSLLSNIYKNKPKLRDNGFTMYYMSINLGSLLSILLTPWIVKKFGWTTAFSVPVISLIVTLLIFLNFKNVLNHYGSKYDHLPINISKILPLLIWLILSPILIYYILNNVNVTNMIIKIIIVTISAMFIKKIYFLKGIKKKKMIVTLILMTEAVIFFVLYNQIPTSLNFFAIRNVKHSLLGMNVSPEQFQALNPFWIIALSPILTIIYNKLGNKLDVIYKFAVGMILCAMSFLVIPMGIYINTDSMGLISPIWLILSYALQSAGELMISGLGLSMISQLVPKKLIGFTVGSWFLTSSISVMISGQIAKIMSFPKNSVISTFDSLNIYYSIFLQIGIYSSIISIIILLIAPILNSITKK